MTKSPAGLQPDFVRFFVLGRFAYPLGILGHIGFIVMFWLLDLKVLVAFNVFSVAIFSIAIWVHNRGEISWPVFLTVLFEVPVHAVLATVYIGLGSAFWIFFLISIVIILLVPFFRRSVRIALSMVFTFALAALAIFSFYNGPLQPIVSEWVIFFFAFNIALFASILIAVISSYELAVVRAEDALQTEFDRAEMLLLNILPGDIATRLKAREEPLADQAVSRWLSSNGGRIVAGSNICRLIRKPAGRRNISP
jgi:adenylate cyclase